MGEGKIYDTLVEEFELKNIETFRNMLEINRDKIFYEFYALYDNTKAGDTKTKIGDMISHYNYYSDQVFMKKKLLHLTEDDLIDIDNQAR